MQFLCLVPGFCEGGNKVSHSQMVMEIKDLERVLDNENKTFKQNMVVLKNFANMVRTEGVLNSYYFSFYDIPDLIVKEKYSRAHYDLIIKLLNKVKKAYLV